MTIDELNRLERGEFVSALGWVFEHSPWVSERAWPNRPFFGLDNLHKALATEVDQASPEEQMALLRAHPDLGTRARLSHASTSEQTGAGLDQLTAPEFERFNRLNLDYRQKFGFPFLFAVKGSTKHDILNALENRLPRTRDAEFTEALQQVYRIAEFRLRDYLDRED